MGFIDNPVIGNLLAATGLGGLSAAVNAGHSPQNVPTYKDRPYIPKPMSGGGGGGGQQAGQQGTEPGAMSPEVQNNPTVSDLLNHFGVHPQQEVDPHLFVHNAQAWANHPVMSGVLEGLMSGLANTKTGSTVGENLTNIAQSFQTTHDQQIQHVNAQLQMPYNQAMTVAQLQEQASRQDVQGAQMRYQNAQADKADLYWYNLNNQKDQLNATNLERERLKGEYGVKKAQALGDAKLKAAQARPANMSTQQWNKYVSR